MHAVWLAVDLVLFAAPIALAMLVLQRQPLAPLRTPLVLSLIAASLFVAGDLGSLLAESQAELALSLLVLYTGTLWIAPLWWWLAVRFAEAHDRGWRASPWLLRIPFLFAAAAWLAMATNPLHGQFLTAVVGGRNQHHWLWRVVTAGSYVPLIGVCTVYARLATRREFRRRLRMQASILLVATLLPLAANALYHQWFWPWRVDPSVVVLSGSGVLLVVGIYGARLFGVSPISLRALVDHDSAGVVLLDRDGRLCVVNPAAERILGMPLELDESLLSKLAGRLSAPGSEELLSEDELWSQLRRLKDGDSGALYRLEEPGPRWLWISLARIAGRVRAPAWCLRIEDVTRLRQAEEERVRLEHRAESVERLQTIGTNAGSIAHDVTNVLTAILSHAERGLALPEQSEEVFGQIQKEARRGDRLLRSALDALSGEADADLEPESLNACAVRVREFMESYLDREQVSIRLVLASDLPAIPLDAARIEQALENLVRNAVETGGPGTTITVETSRGPDEIRIAVCNDGPGFAPALRERVFGPLFSTRGGEGGTGLGLAIAREAARRHAGEVEVGCDPRKGGRVELRLPIS